jgi:MtN3 and saliva related transmembrane protein
MLAEAFIITVLGVAASALSTLSLLPQVVRTWRTRSAHDISATWLIVALASMLLWICYGSLVSAYAIVWANALTFLQAGLILAIKLRKTGKRRRSNRASAMTQRQGA